jgi:DNA-binding MarR family transcriptional regulator
VYYHNGELSHTIPKCPGATQKVLNFLKNREIASCEEIAKMLKLNRNDVLAVLKKLEEQGLAEVIH